MELALLNDTTSPTPGCGVPTEITAAGTLATVTDCDDVAVLLDESVTVSFTVYMPAAA